MRPRDRLATATKNAQGDDDVKFIKRCLHILEIG